uniref:G-protein coupled receptors family 1 profile domain-containing protein n=1 Tax=Acrobeloides nanus TaxID=290746 RepID=A0A914BUC8_9BILA
MRKPSILRLCHMEYDYLPKDSLSNCSYRYDYDPEQSLVKNVSLWLDGPLTILAGFLALISGHFAAKFLRKAGLNTDLTAALYTLCICDAFLIITVVINKSIEATGILFFGRNLMWNHQDTVLFTFGFVSAATTASTLLVTLLVVFITFRRFLVVYWPLKYARLKDRFPIRPDQTPLRRYSSTAYCSESCARNSPPTKTVPIFFVSRKPTQSVKKLFRPYAFPVFIMAFSAILSISVFFEFELAPCFEVDEQVFSLFLSPTMLRENHWYLLVRTILQMATQTTGPISIITILTIATEYKVYSSLKERRRLFEAQQRRRTVVLLEELKEKVSRTVAIFIAVKFLILRSLPILLDLYESIHGITSFGVLLSILVRVSDFAIVLNSATNSLAYFGKKQWLENRLKGRILRKHLNNLGKSISVDEQSKISNNFVIKKDPIDRKISN